MKTLHFKLNQEIEFPQDLIDDAPKQGKFDSYADYILDNYKVEVSIKDSIAYLKNLGGWDTDELQNLQDNKQRLLWIALLDCKEQETTFWYMGE